jgi:hypothetical protein
MEAMKLERPRLTRAPFDEKLVLDAARAAWEARD